VGTRDWPDIYTYIYIYINEARETAVGMMPHERPVQAGRSAEVLCQAESVQRCASLRPAR
jgi:hypothetical protein